MGPRPFPSPPDTVRCAREGQKKPWKARRMRCITHETAKTIKGDFPRKNAAAGVKNPRRRVRRYQAPPRPARGSGYESGAARGKRGDCCPMSARCERFRTPMAPNPRYPLAAQRMADARRAKGATGKSLALSLRNIYETLVISWPTVVNAFAGRVTMPECDSRLARWATEIAKNSAYDLEVVGRENLGTRGESFLVMSNHQSCTTSLSSSTCSGRTCG